MLFDYFEVVVCDIISKYVRCGIMMNSCLLLNKLN